MWSRRSKEGSRLTQDFLEALTERMGLHYANEATGMAATLPSFMPSQPAPFCREFAPYPVIAYSVFFYSPSFLFSALIPFALAPKCTSAAHICVHAPGRHISQGKPDVRERQMLICSNAKHVLLVLSHRTKTCTSG